MTFERPKSLFLRSQIMCPECFTAYFLGRARGQVSLTHPAIANLECSRVGESIAYHETAYLGSKESGTAYLQLPDISCKDCGFLYLNYSPVVGGLRVRFYHPFSDRMRNSCKSELIIPLAYFTIFV